MTRIAENEAIKAIRAKGYITRYKGYYINVYAKKTDTVYTMVASLKSSNGSIDAKAVSELIA